MIFHIISDTHKVGELKAKNNKAAERKLSQAIKNGVYPKNSTLLLYSLS